ncbi:hypothetical protein ACIQCQ_10520 [Streptomyces sp. NPDC088394]|uniref:hypothetical protein n=1 Tax=Streptomyces sp. NPDC088394 TaxID=3365860 RepID=UPI00381F9975
MQAELHVRPPKAEGARARDFGAVAAGDFTLRAAAPIGMSDGDRRAITVCDFGACDYGVAFRDGRQRAHR